MKRFYTFPLYFLFFFSSLTSYSYTSLSFRDPQGWKGGTGSIDTAELSIKPRGAFLEYGLYLTFSTKPTSYNSVSDTFEVALFFDLPENAIVHDSWLWVGQYISRAQLMDRTRANLIYEGIVNRRKDPSILYKNSATQYELRVFPMAGNQQRKVKITYLVPVSWNSLGVQAQLPVNILNVSQQRPPLQLMCYEESSFTNPAVSEIPNLYFQNTPYGYKSATIPASLYQNTSSLTYSLKSGFSGGVYASYFPVSANEGYYQLALKPGQFLPVINGKKVLMLFDYEPGLSTHTPNNILAQAQNMAAAYLSPGDSFNLMYSQLNVASASADWIPADSAHISSVFGGALAANPISNYSNVPSLLNTAIQFIKTHGGDAEIVLFANTDNQNTPSSANPLINDLMNAMGSTIIPVHIVEYTNTGYSGYWQNGSYFYGNQYFNENLAALTGGSYEFMISHYNSYPYNYGKTLIQACNDVFKSIRGMITDFEAHVSLSNGFCYARYSTSPATALALNETYIQVGKYYGNPVFDVEVTGMYNGIPFQHQLAVNNALADDSLIRKMWVGMFIQQHENSNPNPGNQVMRMIRDTSIQGRVLSEYTAFLALEFADTSLYCATCEDETNGGGGTVSIVESTDSLYVTAFPNPFSRFVNFKLSTSDAQSDVKIMIYNMNGQLVYSTDAPAGKEVSIVWDGNDTEGTEVSAGVYMARIQSGAIQQTIRLMKQ